MDDLISRQAALNELRAWREACAESGHRESASDLKNVIRAFGELPSAQPEIIRCKECKKQGIDNVFRSMWCYEMRTFVKPNEFCGRAERRTGA